MARKSRPDRHFCLFLTLCVLTTVLGYEDASSYAPPAVEHALLPLLDAGSLQNLNASLASSRLKHHRPKQSSVLSAYDETLPPYHELDSAFFCMGGLFDLTEADRLQPIFDGVQHLEAFRCAIQSLNSLHANSTGVTIVYSAMDTQGQLLEHLGASLALLKRNTTAVVGSTSSDEALFLGSFYSQYNVSLVSYELGSSNIAGLNLSSFACTLPSDDLLAKGLVSVMQRLSLSLAVFLFSDDSTGTSGQHSIAAYSDGITLDCSSMLVPSSDTDLQGTATEPTLHAIAKCVASSQANVVLLWMSMKTAQNVLHVLSQYPENSRLLILCSSHLLKFTDDPKLFAQQSHFPVSFLQGMIGLDVARGNQTSFSDYFSSLTPCSNNYDVFLNYWQMQFKCLLPPQPASVGTCSDSLASRTLPLSCTCTGQESLSSVPLDAKVGYIQDAVLGLASALYRIKANCSSIPTSLTGIDYCNATRITGHDIFAVMKSFPVKGVTGLIAFDGINRKNGSFDVIQVNALGERVYVGIYYDDNLELNVSALLFKDGTAEPPRSEIWLDEVTYSTFIGLFFTILAGLNIVAVILLILFLECFSSEPEVRKNSPRYCQLILLGIALLNSGVIVWSAQPSTLTCTLKIWLYCLGIVLIFASLLARSYQLMWVSTRIARLKRSSISVFCFLVVGIEVLLLLVFTLTDGLLTPEVIVTAHDPLYGYISCEPSSVNFKIALTILLILYNFMLLVLAATLTHMARHQPSLRRETRRTNMLLILYLVLVIIFVPSYYSRTMNRGYASRSFVERSVITIIASIGTMAILVLPLVVSVFRGIQEKREARNMRHRIYSVHSCAESDSEATVCSRIVSGQTSEESSSTRKLSLKEMERKRFAKRFLSHSMWRS